MTLQEGPWGLLDAAPDPMIVVDARGVILFANARMAHVFGYARGQLLGALVEVLLPARYRDSHQRHYTTFVGSPSPRSMGVGRGIHALHHDGRELPVEIFLSPAEVSGEPVVIAALHDASAHRLEAEHARAQLQALLANIPDFVMSVDAEGKIEFINRGSARHQRDALIGTTWFSHFPPHEREVMRVALRRVFDMGVATSLEVSMPGEDATLRWFAHHIGPVRQGGAVVGAVVIAREVTEKKGMEARLLCSERMASMGTIAAAVAHEINNPLAAIVANLDLALGEVSTHAVHLSADSNLLEELQDARAAAESVRVVARELKVFSRVDDEVTAVDVRRVLESTLRMASNEVRHRARVERSYEHTSFVEATETRLGQVFLNLILNAAQAIPEGSAGANAIRVSTKEGEDGAVVVEIADTGCGMTAEVRARLFDPFFTTKPVGLGTGLGLAICAQIVSDMGGRIEVQSAPGQGSVFRVSLPASAREAAARKVGVSAEVPASVRRGRVLVIDDEPTIGVALTRVLSREHDVLIEHDAQLALLRLAKGEEFDVIFCDVMMPELLGTQLYEQIATVSPRHLCRVVFLTGGAFTECTRRFLSSTRNLVLEKPFDYRCIRKLVNERVGR